MQGPQEGEVKGRSSWNSEGKEANSTRNPLQLDKIYILGVIQKNVEIMLVDVNME